MISGEKGMVLIRVIFSKQVRIDTGRGEPPLLWLNPACCSLLPTLINLNGLRRIATRAR